MMPGEALVPPLGAAMLAAGLALACARGSWAVRAVPGVQAGLLALAALVHGLAGDGAATLPGAMALGTLLLGLRAAGLWVGARRGSLVPRAWSRRQGVGVAAGLGMVALAALLLQPAPMAPGLREPAVLALAVALLGLLAAALRPGTAAQRAGLAGLGSGILLAGVVLTPALLPWLALAVAAGELGLGTLRGAAGPRR